MKFLLVALVSLALVASTIPAQADNSEEVIIGVLGGALGGLIIGEALGNRRDRHVEKVYIYEDSYDEPECYNKWYKVWDPRRDRYVKVRKLVCY